MARKKAETTTTEPLKAVVIGEYNLNVRDGKSKEHKVVNQLKPGTEVTVLKEGKLWCQIAEGQYVMTEFLKISR